MIADLALGPARMSAMRLPALQQMFYGPAWRRRWAWLWAGLVCVVTIAALTPGHTAPSAGLGDKLDHLLAFASLAASGGLALRSSWRATLAVATGMVVYGGFIELAQTQVPGRVGDWADLLADSVGVALGLALVLALRQAWRDNTL